MKQNSLAERIVYLADTAGLALEKLCGVLCVCCFVAMTVITLLGVFFRYVMQSPFMWTEEAARYLLVWMGFTAISIALRQKKHIKIEVIAGVVPPIIASLMDYCVDVLMMIFFSFLLWQGYLLAANNIMKAATLQFSMVWVLAAIPMAALLSLIQILLKIIQKSASGFIPRPSPGTDTTAGGTMP